MYYKLTKKSDNHIIRNKTSELSQEKKKTYITRVFEERSSVNKIFEEGYIERKVMIKMCKTKL